MNDIKFLAYDKLRKKVCRVLAIDFEKGNARIVYDNESDWEVTKERLVYMVRLADIELMQYTTIDDKNHKEIYANYIVTGNYNDSYEKYVGVVEWNKTSWVIRPFILISKGVESDCRRGGYCIWRLDSDCEAIGNIYQINWKAKI